MPIPFKDVSCRISRLLLLPAAAAFILFSSPAYARADEPVTRQDFIFDTFVSITFYDEVTDEFADSCMEKLKYLESVLSRTAEGSDVWNINHSGSKKVTVCPDTVNVLERALEWCRISEGVFDITIAPVTMLWDFHDSQSADHSLPDEEELKEALLHVDYKGVHIDGDQVSLDDPEAAIDLGGIAKGYAADKVGEMIREAGCERALINLGGNVLTVGSKSDDQPFMVGIQKPWGETGQDIIAAVPVSDMAIVTSGSYERYFRLGGRLYHHILDPKTGMSVESGVDGVTILTADATDADALSTICFALGAEKGLDLIESLEGTEALFVLSDGKTKASEGWPGISY